MSWIDSKPWQDEYSMQQDFLVEKLAAYMNNSFTALVLKWGPVKHFVKFDTQGHGSNRGEEAVSEAIGIPNNPCYVCILQHPYSV